MSHNDFVFVRTRKAVKEHTCQECWRVIPKGEVYEIASGMREGEISALKACLQCSAMRKLVGEFDHAWFGEYYYGGLDTWIAEKEWNGIYGVNRLGSSYLTLLRLIVGFQKKWVAADGSMWTNIDEYVANAIPLR